MTKKDVNIDDELLKNKRIKEKFKRQLKDADIILLGTDELKIFGIISYTTHKVIVDSSVCPEMAKNDTCGAWTDGKKMYFSPFGDTTLGEILALIIHEVIHIVSGHINRIGDLNPILWNIAADHVANSVILQIGRGNNKINFPDGKYVYFPELDQNMPGASVEEVYNYLKQNSKSGDSDDGNGESITITIDGKGNSGGKSTKTAEIVKDNNGNKYVKITDKKTNKSTYVKLDTSPKEITSGNGGGEGEDKSNSNGEGDNNNKQSQGDGDEDGSGMQPLSQKELEETLNDLRQRAASVWQSGMFKGDTSSPISQYFNSITKIETPWEKLLEDAIKYSCQATRRRTWLRKNPYIKNIRTPGRIDKSTGVKYLLFVTDTSGSISDECLDTFLGIIISSYKYVGGLISIKHDVTVHSETIFTSRPSEMALREGIGTVTQRGGTSHKDAFDKIESMYNEYELSMIIFLTDFESDVEHIMDNYTFWKDVPNVWMIVKGYGGRHGGNQEFVEGHNGKMVNVKEKEGVVDI